jgi:hypothetical protein
LALAPYLTPIRAYIQVRFDDNQGQWKRSDATVFVRYQLRY